MRPLGQKIGDIPQGAGASATYNFTPHWGLEADYGGNSNKFGTENTASIGPRIAWRNEGVMLFAHTMLGYNRLTVPLVGYQQRHRCRFLVVVWIFPYGVSSRSGCLKPTTFGRITIFPM